MGARKAALILMKHSHFDTPHTPQLDVGRVHEGAVYESNMSIESGHVSHAITPLHD